MNIKNCRLVFFAILAACIGFEAQLNAQTNQAGKAVSAKPAVVPVTPAFQKFGPLNVRDFGAKGDGVTDDTDAIQRCLLKAAAPDYSVRAAPEVFFPPGIYLISRTLLVPCYRDRKNTSHYNLINLRGEKATIKQACPTEDILYFQRAWRNLIEGLTFEGGKRQIKLWSQNLDSAHIIIRDCIFKNSASYAIDDQLRLDPTSQTKNWYSNIAEPYVISTNEYGLPRLTPIDETPLPMCLFVSTIMRINRCSFQQCMQVLATWADWTLMDDCAIETHPDMNGPAILVGGCLIMDNVQGLAHANPGKNQWWITMDPRKQPSGIVSVDLRNVRLKTDTKDGWWVIRNETKFAGGSHASIIADGCEFQSAGSKENCVLYMVEVPNLINVRNCRETSGREVNILGFANPFEEDYFHFHDPEKFCYVINENNRGMLANMPEAMAQFEDKPLPGKIARQFERKPTTVTLPKMRAGIARQLNIMDFGAKGDGNADDTEAFRKAFAAVRQQSSLAEVLVPNGLYRIDAPVELPPRVIVRGMGHALFTTSPIRKGAAFTAINADQILFQNLDFARCEQAIAITTQPDTKSKILIDNCSFRENRDWAISCLSGTGGVAEANQTTLRISDCTFLHSRVLIHNVHYALMDNPWITTDPDMINSGAIVNKGTFHIKSMVGVPQTIAKTPDAKGHDTRWVDNYHQVFLDGCRFGGEGGGLPMVVNFTSKGQVLLQNGWTCVRKGNPQRCTIVDCEEIPELIALRGNWGVPGPQMMVTIRTGAHGVLKGRFFESGNTAPAWIKDERKPEK